MCGRGGGEDDMASNVQRSKTIPWSVVILISKYVTKVSYMIFGLEWGGGGGRCALLRGWGVSSGGNFQITVILGCNFCSPPPHSIVSYAHNNECTIRVALPSPKNLLTQQNK